VTNNNVKFQLWVETHVASSNVFQTEFSEPGTNFESNDVWIHFLLLEQILEID
jgi:hypothetical protein